MELPFVASQHSQACHPVRGPSSCARRAVGGRAQTAAWSPSEHSDLDRWHEAIDAAAW